MPDFIITIFILFLILMEAVSICHGNQCEEYCGTTPVPYPFRLKNCGLKEFQVHCNSSNSKYSLELQLHKYNFTIVSITSQSLLIDPTKGGCGEPNLDYFKFIGKSSYTIPKTRYTISKNNALMMYHCGRNSTDIKNSKDGKNSSDGRNSTDVSCRCDFRPEFNGIDTLESHYNCPSYFCCGLTRDKTLLDLMENCTSFIGWTLDTQFTGLGLPIDIRVHYGLQLEAWVPGDCKCASDAICITNTDLKGYSCSCNDGLLGDGFADGLGCYSNVSVQPSCRHGSFFACTRNIVLLSAGAIAGAGMIALGVGSMFVKKQQLRDRGVGACQSRKDIKKIESLLSTAGMTKVFTYRDLEKATKGFSDDLELGRGAFSTVYSGRLSNGSLVAVKRINYRYMQGIQQVVNEVKLLSAVKHPNLVQLLGCCLEYGDPLLVYEYVPNGTLCEHLQGQRGAYLTWQCRVTIACETAHALSYLHSLDPPIYHRDVKSSNILLCYDFTSKVADFGLSRLVLTDGSHVSTVPQGTPGYLDPDYHQNYQLSDKSDVYSFGVVLVEMITAMKAVDFTREKNEINLATLAVIRIGNGTLDDIIDKSLEAGENPQMRASIQIMAEIAYRCLSHDKNSRPTIKEVAQELELVRNDCMKMKANRICIDKPKAQLSTINKEGSLRVVSFSSTEGICGSNESSFDAC